MAAMPPRAWPVAATLAVYVTAFLAGAGRHARDFLWLSWSPYAAAPPAIEAFWTSLIALDLAVVLLLLSGWRRAGLTLALAVMVVDVGVDGYWSTGLGFALSPRPLLLQAMLLAFILGSIGFLWPPRRVGDLEGRNAPPRRGEGAAFRACWPADDATGGKMTAPSAFRRECRPNLARECPP